MDPLQIVVWRTELERRLDASMTQHHHEQAREQRATGSVARPSRSRRRDRKAPVTVGSALAPQS